MQGQKRHFPYHSNVPEVELKRPNVAAGYESAQPSTFEAPSGFGGVTQVTLNCVVVSSWQVLSALQSLKELICAG